MFFSFPNSFISLSTFTFNLKTYIYCISTCSHATLFLHSEPDPHHTDSGGAPFPCCGWRYRGGCGEEQKASVPTASHPGAQPHIWGLWVLQHSQPHWTGLGGWDLHSDTKSDLSKIWKKTLMLCVIVSLLMWETYSWGRLSLCTSQKQIWWTAQKMLNLVIMSALVCQGTRDVLILETPLLLDCIICNAAAPSHYSTAMFLAWGNHTNILHCLRWVTQATANSLRGSFSHRRKINHVHHLDLLDHLS